MFRIDRSLVQQQSQPADIPLIPIPLPHIEPEPEQEGTLEEKVAAANMQAASPPVNNTAQSEAMLAEARQKAQEKAQQIIEEAEQQAAKMLQDAEQQLQEQADAIRADAWQSGLEEGKHAAKEQIRQEQEQWQAEAKGRLQELLGEIATKRDEAFALMEGEIIDLALAVAQKIAHQAIDDDGAVLTNMMRQALRQMRHEAKITIQVSEEQYNTYFREQSPSFILGDEELNVAIVGNPELQPGDLLLESEDETVNASIASQMKQITLAFGRPWEPGL